MISVMASLLSWCFLQFKGKFQLPQMTDFGQNSNFLVISCCDSIISVCLLVIIVNIWTDNICKVDGDIFLWSFNSFPGKKSEKVQPN